MMKEEKKRQDSKNKIVSIDVGRKKQESPEIDELVRKSIMEEADKIEAELNSAPEMQGVGASDDMFAAIVKQLKERGIWEEDEPPAKEEKTSAGIASDGAEKSTAEEKEESLTEPECVEENLNETERNEAENSEFAAELGLDEEERKRLYRLLPEKDREALELGYRVMGQDEVRKKKALRCRRVLKYSGIAAVFLVLLLGVGMTGEASRSLILKAWNGLLEGFGLRILTNYVNEEESIRSKSKEEEQALADIRESLGLPVIEFWYLPKGMEYSRYEIADNNLEAMLFYEYGGQIFSSLIINIGKMGSSYQVFDGEVVLRETVITDAQELEIQIWETNLDIEEETYIADLEYGECRYIINGKIPLTEMVKILENAIIL